MAKINSSNSILNFNDLIDAASNQIFVKEEELSSDEDRLFIGEDDSLHFEVEDDKNDFSVTPDLRSHKTTKVSDCKQENDDDNAIKNKKVFSSVEIHKKKRKLPLIVSPKCIEEPLHGFYSDEAVINHTHSSTSSPLRPHLPDALQSPGLTNFVGEYGFRIFLDERDDSMKTPSWLRSTITNKLYTNLNKSVPLRIGLDQGHVKENFFLRASAVFKFPGSYSQNVVRCPIHICPEDTTNINFAFPNHVIRISHPLASYETSFTGRLSVVIPVEFSFSLNEPLPVFINFMCLSSCAGGINRRPILVLIELETEDQEIIGRFVSDVKVCACPVRDSRLEEKQLIAKERLKSPRRRRNSTSVSWNLEIFRVDKNHRSSNEPHKNPSEVDEGSRKDQVFYLPICGQKLFNYLQDAKHSYLKHHPEYAIINPDPPVDTLRVHYSPLAEGRNDAINTSHSGTDNGGTRNSLPNGAQNDATCNADVSADTENDSEWTTFVPKANSSNCSPIKAIFVKTKTKKNLL